MILMIDNYCSFTYNIAQYFAELQQDIVVKRNDEISLDEIASLAPKAIILGSHIAYSVSYATVQHI